MQRFAGWKIKIQIPSHQYRTHPEPLVFSRVPIHFGILSGDRNILGGWEQKLRMPKAELACRVPVAVMTHFHLIPQPMETPIMAAMRAGTCFRTGTTPWTLKHRNEWPVNP